DVIRDRIVTGVQTCALPICILIAVIIHLFVPEVNFLHLWAWTFSAVAVHVFVDIFNAYGTQAYRPFTSKWVAHGFINTFDPYIRSEERRVGKEDRMWCSADV